MRWRMRLSPLWNMVAKARDGRQRVARPILLVGREHERHPQLGVSAGEDEPGRHHTDYLVAPIVQEDRKSVV